MPGQREAAADVHGRVFEGHTHIVGNMLWRIDGVAVGCHARSGFHIEAFHIAPCYYLLVMFQ